jgi:beta-N-acetylhexosaminidase
MLMTAHVVYTALDPERPATLSRTIMTDLLRRRLGFTGVLASDDLAMQALEGHGDVGERAVAAIAAGCDMVLACQSLEDGDATIAALKAAARTGRLEVARIREALAHVSRLKQTVGKPARNAEIHLPDPRGALVLASLDKRLASLAQADRLGAAGNA